MRDSYIIIVILSAALLGICSALAMVAYYGSHMSGLRSGLCEAPEERTCGDVCMSYEEFYLLRCVPRERGVIDGCYGVDGGVDG